MPRLALQSLLFSGSVTGRNTTFLKRLLFRFFLRPFPLPKVLYRFLSFRFSLWRCESCFVSASGRAKFGCASLLNKHLAAWRRTEPDMSLAQFKQRKQCLCHHWRHTHTFTRLMSGHTDFLPRVGVF